MASAACGELAPGVKHMGLNSLYLQPAFLTLRFPERKGR